MRMLFFGPDGDTSWNRQRLRNTCPNFEDHDLDIRNRDRILELIKELRPHLLIHCAAQPSHDLARDHPFDDFEINATGTLNLLEGMRRYSAESPFIFMSTNKVYGDAPNERPLKELPSRWEYATAEDWDGVDECCRIDQSLHSLFGVSKTAADLLVQEYGRYFNMPTVCFRGGCLTGPHHSGARLHGFLIWHAVFEKAGLIAFSATRVSRYAIIFTRRTSVLLSTLYKPRCAAVYNLGGTTEFDLDRLRLSH